MLLHYTYINPEPDPFPREFTHIYYHGFITPSLPKHLSNLPLKLTYTCTYSIGVIFRNVRSYNVPFVF